MSHRVRTGLNSIRGVECRFVVEKVFSIMDGDHMTKTTKVKERMRESLKLLNFTPDSTKERLL